MLKIEGVDRIAFYRTYHANSIVDMENSTDQVVEDWRKEQKAIIDSYNPVVRFAFNRLGWVDELVELSRKGASKLAGGEFDAEMFGSFVLLNQAMISPPDQHKNWREVNDPSGTLVANTNLMTQPIALLARLGLYLGDSSVLDNGGHCYDVVLFNSYRTNSVGNFLVGASNRLRPSPIALPQRA